MRLGWKSLLWNVWSYIDEYVFQVVLPEAEVLNIWPSVIMNLWAIMWRDTNLEPWSLAPQFPRAHMFQSSGVRLQDDQGNQLLWKAAQQDAHHLQEMRKCKQLLMSYLRTYQGIPQVSFHIQKKTCAACGFPAAKIRGYNWSIKVMWHARWVQRSLSIYIYLCL